MREQVDSDGLAEKVRIEIFFLLMVQAVAWGAVQVGAEHGILDLHR